MSDDDDAQYEVTDKGHAAIGDIFELHSKIEAAYSSLVKAIEDNDPEKVQERVTPILKSVLALIMNRDHRDKTMPAGTQEAYILSLLGGAVIEQIAHVLHSNTAMERHVALGVMHALATDYAYQRETRGDMQ